MCGLSTKLTVQINSSSTNVSEDALSYIILRPLFFVSVAPPHTVLIHHGLLTIFAIFFFCPTLLASIAFASRRN